jgi:hypothetical protein
MTTGLEGRCSNHLSYGRFFRFTRLSPGVFGTAWELLPNPTELTKRDGKPRSLPSGIFRTDPARSAQLAHPALTAERR